MRLMTRRGRSVRTAEIQRLAAYVAKFQDRFDRLFRRPENRHWAREYVAGLLMDLERKNCWQIAEARHIAPEHLKSLQHFLYGSTWHWAPVIEEMAGLIDEHLGTEEGIVVVDESGVRRWGRKSVGIARQYLGTVGKVENGQVGVYLTYVSPQGQGFLDTRLYLPKEWMADPARCREAGIPDAVLFRTKPQLAAAMVECAARRGVRARWLTADEAYGQDGAFREVVDAVGWWYVAEVPVKQHVWAGAPGRSAVRRARGENPRKSRENGPSRRVDDVARDFTDRAWQRIQVGEGTLGRRVYEFAFRRVVERWGHRPGRAGWLMVRRSLDQEPEVKYFLSNAPATVERERMAVVGSERWRVESCVKEAKGQTGLDESEGRNWNHWHHHTTLSMLAHAFLTCARLRWAKTHFPPVGTEDPETGGPGPRRTVA